MHRSACARIDLTSFQKELWLAHLSLPESHPGIFCGGSFLLEGRIDPDTARQALRYVVAQLPLLGATLELDDDGMPHFVPGVHQEPSLTIIDVSAAPDPEQAALDARAIFIEKPFEPLGGPLVCFALIFVHSGKAYFLNKNFHLISSGLGASGHFSLFTEYYEKVAAGEPIFLCPSDWQEEVARDEAHLASARAISDAGFWQESLRRAPRQRIFQPLPGRPDTLGDSAVHTLAFSAKGMRHLHTVSAATGLSPTELLTAAHSIALNRLLDGDVPNIFIVENGERKDPARMQGFAVNIMPFVPPLTPDMTFADALRTITAQMKQMRRHARTSVSAAIRTTINPRDMAHLWDTNINIIPSSPAGNSHYARPEFIPLLSTKERGLLALYVLSGVLPGDPLRLVAHYSRNHFTEDGVRRHAARIEAVLATLAHDDGHLLGAWSPLLEEERACLQQWEQGPVQAVPPCSIPRLFDQIGRHYADNPAVCGEDGSRRSYTHVAAAAGVLARQLAAAGVRRGDVVAVLARRHPALAECILGVMACGGVYLPVDPEYPASRVRHMLDDSGARLTLALDAHDIRATAGISGGKTLLWQGLEQACEGLSATWPQDWMPVPTTAEDPAYLIYTSGSTGTPKGVLVPHGGFVNMILAQIEAFGVTPADHVLHFASPSFDASLSEIFMALMAGAASYPVSRQRIDNPWALRDHMARHHVSVVTLPPSYLALFKGEPFPGLRVLLTAGENPISADVRHYSRQVAYFNAYGPTEASVCASLQRLKPDEPSCTIIGRPLPNTGAHVLDARGHRVAPGLAGELWLSGAGLAIGYHRRPELTAERFCTPPGLAGLRCYRTGDRACWTADGRLMLLGRTDEQVKIRGHRVELGEVVATLEQHPDVAQAVVIAVQHDDSQRIAAFLLPRAAGAVLDLAALSHWLGDRLPVYMLPHLVSPVEAFPVTPAGKVDKQALEKTAREHGATHVSRAVLSPDEARLAAVFAAVLGHEVTDPVRDFFHDGGDSLKAVDLLHRLEREHGLKLSMRAFMAAPTLRAVAAHLRESASFHAPTTLTATAGPQQDATAPIPCTQGQIALWAQELSHGPSARYHMPLLLELTGQEAATLAFAEAVHRALAAQPLCSGRIGGPVEQPVFLPHSLPVPVCRQADLRGHSKPESVLPESVLDDALDAFIHEPFALDSTPPVRLALWRTGETTWLFCLVVHHIAADAQGLHAVLNDALRFVLGENLPEGVTLSRIALLREAVAEEAHFLFSPEMAAERAAEHAFWQSALLPLPPSPLAARPTTLSGQGAQHTATLSPATADGLRRVAKAGGTTALGAMLGLLGTFLCRRAGSPACVVSVPVGTREGVETAGVCGYFVNPLPLRLRPMDDAHEAARRAGELLRATAAHNRLPAHLLAEALGVPPTERAVLTEILATQMDLGLPPWPEACGLAATPRLPYLRAAKTALSFLLLTENDVMHCALEHDEAAVSAAEARTLLEAWVRFITHAVDAPEGEVVIHSGPATAPATAQSAVRHPVAVAASVADTAAEATAALRQAWHEVLGVVPAPTDHFFLSGGDSIKAIQLSGRLRQAGFPDFAPAACFEQPLFNDLCAHLGARAVRSPQVPAYPMAPLEPGEAIALLPLHRLWVTRHPEHWHHFHMALPLRVAAGVDIARLRAGVFALGSRHEALRTRFTATSMRCLAPCEPAWLERDFPPRMPLEDCFAEASRALFAQLNEAATAPDGPIYGGLLFRHEKHVYLLIAGHHFALDALSLDIIRRELIAFCAQGQWPEPDPGHGAASWAKALATHGVFANDAALQAEIAFWNQDMAALPEADMSLPPSGCLADRISLQRTVAAFTHDATRANSGLPEVLAALAVALGRTGSTPLLLTLESHGREELVPGMDCTRAIGWFTAAFPLVVRPLATDIPDNDADRLLDTVRAWATRLETLPGRGARYAFAAVHAPELAARRSDLSLNYLGAALTRADADSPLTAMPEHATPQSLPGMIPPGFVPESPLDVLAFFREDGSLELRAAFSPEAVLASAVSDLLEAWGAALEAVSKAHAQLRKTRDALAAACLSKPEALEEFGLPDPAQEAMLYQLLLDQEAGQPAAHYVQQITFTLRPDDGVPLDVTALEAAWHDLIVRHEGLRTLFPRTARGEQWRVVVADARTAMERLDLSTLPSDLQRLRRDERLRELRQKPFDLSRGPLLFLMLFHRRDARGQYWEMSWCFPHVLMDGWCIGIMLRELTGLYAARTTGQPLSLPLPPSLARVRVDIDTPDPAALRAYWSDALAGYAGLASIADALARRLPPVTLDATQDATEKADIVMEHVLELDETTGRALTQAAAALSVSMPQLIQAAWAVLLGADAGRDVVFGVVHSGRPAHVPGVEDVIGLFIRTLPVRVCWTEQTPFADLAAQVRSAALARTPRESDMLADIQLCRPEGGALFDHLLVFENYPLDDNIRHSALPVEAVEGFERQPYPLAVSMLPGQRPVFRFSADARRIPPAHVRGLITAWHSLLRHLAAQLHTEHVAAAPVLCGELETAAWPSAVGPQAVPAAFNDTTRPYERDGSIHGLFFDLARDCPERPACIATNGDLWTYGELAVLASRVAYGLRGLTPGEPVALAIPRGPEAVAAMLGVLAAGGSYMPLDERSPAARIGQMLESAACTRVIRWPHGNAVACLPEDSLLHILNFEDLIRNPACSEQPEARGGDAPAYVLFTSGTTGLPKGVLTPHRAVLRLVRNNSFWQPLPGERVAQTAPFSFDAATLEVWGPLLNGGVMVFLDDDTLLSPPRLRQRLEATKTTQMWLTAGLFSSLAAMAPTVFTPLRQLFTGGDSMNPTQAARVLAACPNLELFNGYGPTENTTFTAVHRVLPHDVASGTAVPLGPPISNTRAYILTDQNELAPLGAWGELCVAGDGLSIGYMNNKAATDLAFHELLATGERVYRTGDLARWRPDGVLEFGGRRDAQIKLRGFRIELQEVESALLRLDGVKDAAATVIGEGADKQLLACVTGVDILSQHAMLAALRERLPEYMLPAHILPCDTLPVDQNGKRDRKALAALAAHRLGTWKQSKSHPVAVPDVPAANATPLPMLHLDYEEAERGVAAAFSAVLDMPVHGAQADFFHLGGQSLKAMRLLVRLNSDFGVSLTLSALLRLRTVGAMAERIVTLSIQGQEPAPQNPARMQSPPSTRPDASWPLAPTQEQLWFQQRLHPDSEVYSVINVVHIHGPLDMPALERALHRVEERHEALCLRLPDALDVDGPRQRLTHPGALRLRMEDCRNEPNPAETVATLVAEEQRRPFRLGYDQPLVRASCFLEGAESTVFMLTLHHCLCDGWALELLMADIDHAYGQEVQGQSATWAQPAPGFLHLLEARAARLAGSEGKAALERWTQRLKNPPEPLLLPADHPRPAVRTFDGQVLVQCLPFEMVEGLHRLATAHGVTLFPVLLALVNILCARHSGARDMVLGVPVACRDHPEEQAVVGLLMNVLPLRLHLGENDAFADCVNHCAAVLGEALDDAALCPLETILRRIEAPRDAGRNPLFDVLVAYEERTWSAYHTLRHLRCTPYPLAGGQSRLDLSLFIREKTDGFEIHWEYSTALFTPDTIGRMAARFEQLIRNACDTPEKLAEVPALQLPLLTEEETHLLQRFNDTATDWDCSGGIHARFTAQAVRTPDAVALRTADGANISYAELEAHAARLAGWLTAHGVRSGDAVGLCFARGVDMMLAIFAVMRAGCFYVPFTPDMPPERVAAMLEDLPEGSAVWVTPEQKAMFTAAVSHGRTRVLCTRSPLAEVEANPLPLLPSPAEDALAYILFTSGSTGRPKGVMVEQHSVLNRIIWMQSCFALDASDVILQKTPVSFDVSVWELFWWSWYGASLALLAPGDERDPAAIVEAVHRHQVTTIHFVPSMLRIFLEHCTASPEAIVQLASLKRVFASGEALTPDCVRLFNTLLFETHGTELHNLYGPTEATVDVTWQPCSPFASEATRVPIGRPISNTTISVRDSAGQLAPLGVAGELVVSGVQVARGYVNRPDLTSNGFSVDAKNGDRTYRTGDLARWTADGVVEYLGRLDDQVKIRGFRIELGEVEAALEACASVAQAVARVGSMGGLPALEAFLLPAHGQALSLADIRQTLDRRLPAYMHPSMLYRTTSIPLSSSGKANRQALHGERLDMRGAKNASGAGATPVAVSPPASAPSQDALALETAIRQIWCKVLPEATDLPADLGFFDAGGSSLLLVRLFDQLQQRWPGSFTLPDLFAAPTIGAQADVLRAVTNALGEANRQSVEADEPIAIIGMGLRLAEYADARSFWTDLITGVDRVTPLPQARIGQQLGMLRAAGCVMDDAAFKQAAYLDDISGFDHARFGMAPNDARLIDPEQRLFISTALLALEDAGYGGKALDNAAVGVFAGASPSWPYKHAVIQSMPEQAEQSYVLNVPSAMAARLSYLHNWSGPAAVVDTACSAVLVALHTACTALRRGECTLALVGGSRVQPALLHSTAVFAIESATARTRAFDASADGTCAGEGAVVFLLKPLTQALADADDIHALILGSAVNQDGRSAGIAAPNPASQAAVIKAAAQAAHLAPADLHFIEAHGTGTALGDPVEIDGLRRAFADNPPKHSLPVSSVKGYFGHLDAAAGGLGVAKAVMCLRHGLIPAQPHLTRPNPRIDFAAARVHVPMHTEALSNNRRPWRGGVSSFGLSGVNAHVVLGEAPITAPVFAKASDGQDWHLVPLSASSARGLRRYAQDLLLTLEQASCPLSAIAATLSAGRDHLPFRAAFVARTLGQLRHDMLRWLCQQEHTAPATPCEDVVLAVHAEEDVARHAATAFLGGASPRWDATRPHARVHLPPAPLEQIPCWPSFTASAALASPWPGAASTTCDGTHHAVPVNDPSFWPMAEHRVAGRPTLVGMAFPALVGNAALRQQPGVAITLEGVHWLRPLTADACAEATLTLARKDNDMAVTLSGGTPAEHADEGWNVFAEARLQLVKETSQEPVPNPFVPHAGMAPLAPPVPSRDEAFGGVSVSERWHCREAAWRSQDGLITVARLRLPPRYAADLAQLPWHPALLDTAASLALDGRALLPTACARVILRHPLPEQVWARCVLRSTPTTRRGAAALIVDCRMHDDTGRELASLEGLAFLPVRPPAATLHTINWTPLPKTEHAASFSPVVLLADAGPLGDALAEHLTRQPETPFHHMPYPRGEGDALKLVECLRAHSIRHVLTVLPEDSEPWDAAAPVQTLLGALHTLALQPDDCLHWLCVGRGHGPKPTPEHGLARGVLLAARQEDARFDARFVDWPGTEEGDPAVAASALIDHLFLGQEAKATTPYGWLQLDATGRIHCHDLSPPLPSAPVPVEDIDGCVVISGGLGGMALTLAGQVTPALGRRVALVHRGHFSIERASAPEDAHATERRAALHALREQGVDVGLYSCDVTDATALAAILEQIRRERGPIVTVIHAAGLPGDGFLLRKGRTDFEAVVTPKLRGAQLLHTLTRNDPLRHFVLASSRTALNGAAGQSDYTAANAALDNFARWRAAQGLPALSLGWNTWAHTGMAARAGVIAPFMLHPSVAGEALMRALASGETHVVLGLPGEAASSASHAPTPLNALPTNAQDLKGRPPAEVVRIVVERVLGYEGTLSLADDFFALGGDSLSGTRIVTAVSATTGVPVSLADLLTNSRLSDFAERVAGLMAQGGAHAPSAPQPAPPLDAYPVSHEQLAVLRAVAVSAPHTGYNLPQFIPLPTDCDADSLNRALRALVVRQEILRTHFVDLHLPFPRMVVAEHAEFVLETAHFPTLQAAAASLVRPFSLGRPPLFRAALVRIDALPADGAISGPLLFFDIHHALADAKGVAILLHEMRALLAGETLPPPGLHMKDAAWHQQQTPAATLSAARAYWLAEYADGFPRTDLAADYDRPSLHSNRGGTCAFTLSQATRQALKQLAAAHGATLSSLLQALWALLLTVHTDADEMVMALAADSRAPGFENTAGMFACLLPLRLRVDRHNTMEALIRAAQRGSGEALRHKTFALGNLLAELKPPLDLSRTMLAEVTFSYMNYGIEEPEAAPYSVPHEGCKADLAIFVSDVPEGLLLALEYYADLFTHPRMTDLGQRFTVLAETLTRHGAQITGDALLRAAGVEPDVRPGQALPAPEKRISPSSASSGTIHGRALSLALEAYRTFFDLPGIVDEDNFFELGGHSLLAMQMVNMLNERLALGQAECLRLREFLLYPTPHALAARLSDLATSMPPADLSDPVERATPCALDCLQEPANGLYPLSHAQQRLYVLQRMDDHDTSYNMAFVFQMHRPLHPQTLQKALHSLAWRHDMLRTVILEQDGALWQRVEVKALPPCLIHEIPLSPPEACAVAVREALMPFDLGQGLLRLVIHPTIDGGQCLALGMHHLAGDGWSMQIFFGELMALYAEAAAPLTPLPLQYRHYALWQQQRDWSEAAAYWREHLRDLPPPLMLPADAAATGRTPEAGHGLMGVVTRRIAPHTIAAVRRFAIEKRLSLASCLLTLFAALLARLSRQDDLLIGMGVAGRERKELEGIVGFFVNILPIRVRVPAEASLDELLTAVNAACLEALNRQDYPFDLLVRECAPANTARREQQLVNVMFEYQRYSDVAHINTLTDFDGHIVDEETWLPLADRATPRARYDLTLYVQDEPQGVLLRAEYDSARYTGDAAGQWLAFLEAMMERLSPAV